MTPIDENTPDPMVRAENGYAVIYVPMHEVHGLRVALADCPCRATKSIATMNIRQRLARALGHLRLPR